MGIFIKGQIAYNKGVRNPKVVKNIGRIQDNVPVECKTHGEHLNWRLDKQGEYLYPKCMLCQRENSANWSRNNKDRINQSRKKLRQTNPLKYLIKNAVHNSRKKEDRVIDLTENYLKGILKKQNNKCALSGLSFDSETRISLDRIDATIGYIEGNVQLVTVEVNYAKQSMSNEEFIKLCKQVVSNSKKKKK